MNAKCFGCSTAAAGLLCAGLLMYQAEVDQELPSRVPFVDIDGLKQVRKLAHELGIAEPQQAERVSKQAGQQVVKDGRPGRSKRRNGTEPRGTRRGLPEVATLAEAGRLFLRGHSAAELEEAAARSAARAGPLEIRRIETAAGPVFEIRQ